MSVEAGFEVASAYVALLIDDADFEAAVTEKIENACAVGAGAGGDVMVQGLTGAAAKSGDEIESALLEAVAGSGDAMAVQIGDGLTSGLVQAAARAGDEAGSEAGDNFTAEFDTATAGVGADLGERLVAGVDQVAPHVAQVATGAVGQAFAAGMSDSLASTALEAGALSKLSSSLADAAAEAGGTAGVELSRNLSEAAVAALSDEDFAAFTDMLVATASAAGGEAGTAAGETFGASFSASVTGIDLIAEGLSTVGQSMKTGAQALAQDAADEMAQVEEATLTGAKAYEAELDAVFESIHRQGAGLPVNLAAAMTEAFQGIEADTSEFTATEKRLFEQFIATLETQGDQAAQELAARMSIMSASESQLIGQDLLSQNLSTAGAPLGSRGGQSASEPEQHAAQLAAENAAAMGEMSAAADTADAAVGGLGATMGGPLMWGLLGVASMLPMVGSMFNSSGQAAQAQAQALSQLDQAISQDSNMIGANTVATITNQLATSGAADTLKGYGISLDTATAAMAGVKSAQGDVNDLLNEQIDNLQSLIQEQSAHSQGVNTDIESERQQIEQLVATRDAMKQLEQDVVDQVQHQNELTQATLYAEQASGVFNVQVRAGVLALEQQATTAKINADALGAYDMTLTSGTQAYTDALNNQGIALADSAIKTRINAEALNDSLAPQAQLSGEAITASLAYQQASTATGAYTNALTALYGQYGTVSGAQATFTTDLDNLHGKIIAGKDAVDLNTQAGAANFTQFQQVAQAAESYAEKLYQQTGDSQQATQALQDMAGKLDTAAGKAKLTKDQIHQLNEELFGVQNASDITIHLDATQAEQQMQAFTGFVQGEIDSMNNTTVVPTVNRGLHGISARATGGPVQAGQMYITGEKQPELFVPDTDGYIYPSLDEGRKALAGAGMSVHFNYYGTQQPSHEQRADMLRELAVAVGVGA